jgi:hypothetical protein
MIRVTVELVSARTGKTSVLGTAKISNNLTGSPARGNYTVKLHDKAGRLWKESTVHGFPRKRLLTWDLLFRALNATVGIRNF